MKTLSLTILTLILGLNAFGQNCDSTITIDKFTKEQSATWEIKNSEYWVTFKLKHTASKTPGGTTVHNNFFTVNYYRKMIGTTSYIQHDFLRGSSIYFLFDDNVSIQVQEDFGENRPMVGGFTDFYFYAKAPLIQKFKTNKLIAVRIDAVIFQADIDVPTGKQSDWANILKCMGQ